jgi:hypothetical protein
MKEPIGKIKTINENKEVVEFDILECIFNKEFENREVSICLGENNEYFITIENSKTTSKQILRLTEKTFKLLYFLLTAFVVEKFEGINEIINEFKDIELGSSFKELIEPV